MRARCRERIDPDLPLLAGVAAIVLVFLLWPFVARGYRFPLGPDAPVYLWWTRLSAVDGLSAVEGRPGVPAVALVLAGTVRLPLVAITAGLEVATGVAAAVAGAALTRSRTAAAGGDPPAGSRAEWVLAGILCGAFSVHLAAGYLANLAFAAAFLAALAALATETKRGAVAAAALLGGGGLAHPPFFVLGALILALSAASVAASPRTAARRGELGRIAIAVGGGAALLGAGLVSMLAGAPPPDVDTSKDAILRRLGLTGELRAAYWDRFLDRSARYVHWVSIPLALFGLGATGGFVGRVLRSWGVAAIAGVALGLATGWFPADRFVTFGFVVPILASIGLIRLSRSLSHRRTLAIVVPSALAAAMVLGAAFAWRRQAPFMSAEEVAAVTRAGRFISSTPTPTSSLFLVSSGHAGLFELARAGNVVRAALPPDRIRDAAAVPDALDRPSPAMGEPPAVDRDAAARLLADAIRAARERSGSATLVFTLRPFASRDDWQRVNAAGAVAAPAVGLWNGRGREPPIPLEIDAAPRPVDRPASPLERSSPAGISLAAAMILAVLGVAGLGWARACVGRGASAFAVAPALGLTAITLVAIATDRVGVRLTGWAPAVAAALAGGGGYALWLVLQRRGASQPPAQVGEQP